MKVAAEKAKKLGLEFYAILRPYDTGLSFSVPEGSPKAYKLEYDGLSRLGGPCFEMMDFILKNPQLRIKRRMTDVPAGIDSIPIHRIKLLKKDDSPTRIKKENIEFWTSPNNYKYKKKEIKLST